MKTCLLRQTRHLRKTMTAHCLRFIGSWALTGKKTSAGTKQRASEEEVEAWKNHFEDLQKGKEKVNERVWQAITVIPTNSELGARPTRDEVRRAINKMKLGKAGGEDEMLAEYLKMGSEEVFDKVFTIVDIMWQRATQAADGEEASGWPPEWNTALVCPLFKNKGSRTDKGNYRGITLLSVGTKLLARVVAERTQVHSESFLGEHNAGFRKGRGVDDLLQVSRRICEEAAKGTGDMEIWLRFYDIEKAYPRVCREALWTLLEKLGYPRSFIKVCKAIHEGTEYKVKWMGTVSKPYRVDKGLREGCPSSPPLFNCYHFAVMTDFRRRREASATAHESTPGLRWKFKIDGNLVKKSTERSQEVRHVKTSVIGDFGFADDTAIVGETEEIKRAEEILIGTMIDWREKIHPGKTEGLRIAGGPDPTPASAVAWHGEKEAVRHCGGWLDNAGATKADTLFRAKQAKEAAYRIAKRWGRKQTNANKDKCRLRRSVRLKLMRSMVEPKAFRFCKTRRWLKSEVVTLQRALNYAVRRCFNLHPEVMQKYGISDKMLFEAAGWDPAEIVLRRQCLLWLGHVARMPITRKAKQALFGWIGGQKHKSHVQRDQATWLEQALNAANVNLTDWFRLAQNRHEWRNLVYNSCPRNRLSVDQEKQIDAWRLGKSLPKHVISNTNEEQQQAQDGWSCPVCGASFAKANSAQKHYDETHAVSDPSLVTSQTFECTKCKKSWRSQQGLEKHDCPATRPPAWWGNGEAVENAPGPAVVPPLNKDLNIYTNGSGGPNEQMGAGWGFAAYDGNHDFNFPCAKSYGPVIVEPWCPCFLGATAHTNNTAEISAMVEALLWVEELADSHAGEELMRVVMYYDSEYAASTVRGMWQGRCNMELANNAKLVVQRVRGKVQLVWKHVYGHTGNEGNELADRLADRGAQGKLLGIGRRWANMHCPNVVVGAKQKHMCCKFCGKAFASKQGRWNHENQSCPQRVQH